MGKWGYRFQMAWKAFRGQYPTCQKRHLESAESIVKSAELDALRTAAEELKVARGAISQLPAEQLKQYAMAVEKTVPK